MSPEDAFETALQQYITAVSEYKLAMARYIRDVGEVNAAPMLDRAMNRICYADVQTGVVFTSQTETERRAAKAKPVVDAESKADE